VIGAAQFHLHSSSLTPLSSRNVTRGANMILPASLLKHARRGATTAALFSTQRGGASLKQTGKDAWLVWSPGVPARIAASYVFVAVALAVLYRSPAAHVGERAAAAAQEALLRGAHRAGWWTLLSLLSSSCCVIQFALNMLSVGCAGFNSVLGPARPFFLACALHARVLLRRTAVGALGVDPRVRQLNVYGGAFAVAMAFAPEALALVATSRRRNGISPDGSSSLTLDLPTMGCVACVDSVSRAIRAVDGVVDARVTVGAATVCVNEAAAKAPDAMSASICDAVRRAGFPPEYARWSKP
jgi:copper chaperone CopZ